MTQTETRRTYAREYARRRREQKLAEKLGRSTTCPRANGPAVCGGPLDHSLDRLGRVVTVCRWCERRKAGICRDCPRPVEGRRFSAIRCRSCKATARIEYTRVHQERHREEINKRARQRLRKLPKAERAARNEYKRLYRKANPDKVREQKRRHAARRTPAYVEYHRRYNAMAKRAQRKRDQAKAAYYREHPDRPSPTCKACSSPISWTALPRGRQGRPPTKCDGCCPKAELKRRLKCRAAAAVRVEKPRALPLVKPLKVQSPMEVRYAKTGQRLCLTPKCGIVVTHRKKKCTRCRQREAEFARELLERSRGRGRRTDLEVAA